jgi:LytR cell envelope-related transcriptional attenuator
MSNEDPATSASGPGGGPPRRSPRQGIGGSPVGSTLSIVLAVVAVVAGFLILRNITDDNDGASSAIGDGTDAEATTTTSVDPGLTTTTIPATTTIPPLVTEGATVVVANASGVPGSAGRMSTTLATVGFTMAEATNATTQLETSIVYYDPAVVAAQAVAESVARTMGGLEVAPVPTPVPIEGAALNGSGVVVMLGTAQADKTVEEMAAPATAETPATGTAPAVAGTATTVAGADTTVAG